MDIYMTNNIIAQVSGGEKRVLENHSTVAQVKATMGCTEGFTAMINGSPAADSDALDEGDFVSLSKAVKGGC
jgi:sulfur carrier protein ThiS